MVINDIHEEKTVEVSLEIWNFTGEKVWEKKYEKIQVPRDFVSTIDILKIHDLPTNLLSNTVIYIVVQSNEGRFDNFFLFDNFRDKHLPDPELSYTRDGNNLIFRCKRPAFGVFIDLGEEFILSDNFFTLVPSVSKRVKCLSSKIKVRSLYDYLKK
ncbi:hypothetical protein ES708_22301 [subsurface metagenome]